MASTYTEGLVIELIGSGDKAGSWGDVTNSNLQALNQGITGFSEVDLSGASSPHLIDLSDAQAPDESTSPSRSSIIKFINVPASPAPFLIDFQVNTAPAQRINCVIINGDSSNTISVGTGANGDRLTILNGYAANVYSEVNSGNSSYFDIKNSLANLSVDKIALENNEIIGNATDDKITIGASTLEVGDGAGAVVIKSDDNDLIFKTDETTTNRIRINHGSDDDINVNFDGTGSFNVGGDITTNLSGSITAAGGFTASSGGLTVTTGGINVTAGGLDLNSTGITDAGTISGATLSSANISGATISGATISGSTITTSSVSATSVTSSGNISTTGTGSITAANSLTVSGGGATITGNSTVNGSLTVDSLSAGTGTIETTGNLNGGTTSVGGLTATSLNLLSGNVTNAGTIASGAITSTGAITGTSLDAGSGAIDGGAITGTSLSAGSGTIGGGAITGTSLTVGTGASNTITAGELICNDLSHPTSITSTISSSNKFRVDSNGAQVVATNGYLNMSSTSGSTGFGLRNNSGTLEIKNSTSGGWGSIAVLSGSDLSVSGSLTAGTSVTAGSTITAGTGLTVSAGGASINGGLNNNSDGITNAGTIGAGAITATALNAGSGTIQTTGTVTGGIVAATTSLGAPSVTGTTSVTTPTLTSVSPNGNLTLSPAGIGKIILESSSASDFNNGSAIKLDSVGAINFSTSTTDYTASIIGFALQGDTGASVNRRVVITSDGLSLIGDPESTRYISFSTSRNTGARGFRSNGSVVQVRSKNSGVITDDWGRIYHSGMVSGDGAYVEVTSSYTGASGAAISFDISSLGVTSGDVPRFVELWAKRVSGGDDIGYSEGDWIKLESRFKSGSNDVGYGVWATNSTVNIKAYNQPNWLFAPNKSTGADNALSTAGGWTIYVRAWK